IAFASPGVAQVTTGDITGRVTDAQGKVVSGATVTVTNKATSALRSATTNDSGDYTITELPPGKYDVAAEAKGFSKALLPDFELNVGAKVTQNFELKPGEVSATVQVTSEGRSEEHTSELQSLAYLVCRLLLEKKKLRKHRSPHANKTQT